MDDFAPDEAISDQHGTYQYKRDILIDRLEEEGHQPISFREAIVTIEGCEPGDDVPVELYDWPLKITFYSDPDLPSATVSDEVFLHVVSDIYCVIYLRHQKVDGTTEVKRLLPVDPDIADGGDSRTSLAQMATVKALLDRCKLGRYRRVDNRGLNPKWRKPNMVVLTDQFDEVLDQLGREIEKGVEKYLAHLQTIPDLYRGMELG